MQRLVTISLLFIVMFFVKIAVATSVIAPTFRELVAEAPLVFIGHVTSTKAVWVSVGTQREISTDVTFEVESTLKGEPATTRILRFMGGTLDDYTLHIAGVPQFAVGERAVLFVSATTLAISPLVGVMHGRLSIRQGSDGSDYVTLHDGRAFSSIDQIGASPIMVSRAPVRTMRLADFTNEVRLELRRRSENR